MGLCKCPKRKVTNLFCFEHRVNVCEHCLVDNHPRCIVQSYLNWLKDSDYSPECKLCNRSLDDGKVVRLVCYDLFHVGCLDREFRDYPANTAPAGYKCPMCDVSVFPAQNEAGRVVEKLKEALSKFNWARIGLGMPMIDESLIADDSDYLEDDGEPLHGIPKPMIDDSIFESEKSWDKNQSFTEISDTMLKNASMRFHNDVTAMHVHELSPNTGIISKQQVDAVSRKPGSTVIDIQQSVVDSVQGRDSDNTDNKYKRRSAISWLTRWLRSRMLKGRSKGYADLNALPKKTVIIFIVCLIAFFTFILFATQVGRNRADHDPALDPMLNPNIHVAKSIEVGDLNQNGARIAAVKDGRVFDTNDQR